MRLKMNARLVALMSAVLVFCFVARSESGRLGVGVNLSYPTRVAGLGIGVSGEYDFSSHWRGEIATNYFLEHKNAWSWDLNANMKYLVHLTSDFTVYPLAGVRFDRTAGLSNIGLNAGGGMEYRLTDFVSVNAQGKYAWNDDFDQGIIAVGMVFHF